jgi:hypothetical protein
MRGQKNRKRGQEKVVGKEQKRTGQKVMGKEQKKLDGKREREKEKKIMENNRMEKNRTEQKKIEQNRTKNSLLCFSLSSALFISCFIFPYASSGGDVAFHCGRVLETSDLTIILSDQHGSSQSFVIIPPRVAQFC